jgi:hypothetical protein
VSAILIEPVTDHTACVKHHASSLQIHVQGMTVMTEAPYKMLNFVCTLNIPNLAPQDVPARV